MPATKRGKTSAALTVEDCDRYLESCREILLAAETETAKDDARSLTNLWLDRRLLAMRRTQRAA